VRLLISPGQASDMGAVPQLLEGLSVPVTVVADRGYDSNAVLDLIARSGARPNIPSCSRRIIRRSVDPAINRQRNLIERFFCELKQFRRIATRFYVPASTSARSRHPRLLARSGLNCQDEMRSEVGRTGVTNREPPHLPRR
jgi:transposase